MNATLPLTWEDIHRDARRLAGLLRDKGPFAGLVAVARGGLVPAAILAQELNIRLVETVCVESYDEAARRGEVRVLKSLAGDGGDWLVVDDLVDSGATVAALRALLPKAHYATLYAKPAGLAVVDSFVERVEQSVWVVFPWETTPSAL